MGTSRATATVLFTDLVGSTELRTRLGEGAADDLRRLHDRLLGEAVEAHSGRVVKGLGDGIMATFAAASDAVAAAAAIQQSVERHNRRSDHGERLAVRVGISLGDVTFEDDDVHGTPVIEAARLCAAAAGSQILASDLVRVLVGSGHADGFDPVGPLDLKGLAGPIAACAVIWEPRRLSPIPLPAFLTDLGRIFVGRDAQFDRLAQLWKEAAAGERRVAFLAENRESGRPAWPPSWPPVSTRMGPSSWSGGATKTSAFRTSRSSKRCASSSTTRRPPSSRPGSVATQASWPA